MNTIKVCELWELLTSRPDDYEVYLAIGKKKKLIPLLKKDFLIDHKNRRLVLGVKPV